MFTDPTIGHYAVRRVPGREGSASLATADHVRLASIAPGSGDWVPYCEDEGEGRLVCATGVDAVDLVARGLHYVRLREATTRIATLPPTVVDALTLPAPRIVYAFSPGRCGSTLLCQLLRAAGLASIAEPGFYLRALQRSRNAAPSERLTIATTLRRLERLLLSPFAAADTVVIKPHPYCFGDADLLLGTGMEEAPRTLALLRRIKPWSRSWHKFNNTTVAGDVSLYRLYLERLETLQARTNCLVLSYEDMLADPVRIVARIGAHLQVPLDLGRVQHAAAIDAHGGKLPWEGGHHVPETERDLLLNTLWMLRRPDALIERLGLAALID